MVEENQRSGIEHSADKADDGGDKNQGSRFLEQYRHRSNRRKQQQEEQIPATMRDFGGAGEKSVDAVGVNPAYGIDGGEPGVRKKGGCDDKKEHPAPPPPADLKKTALHNS